MPANESVNAVPPRGWSRANLFAAGVKPAGAGPNCVWRNVLCRFHSMCR